MIVEFKIPSSDDVTAKLEDEGLDMLDYAKRWGRYRARVMEEDLIKHDVLLRELITLAYEDAGKQPTLLAPLGAPMVVGSDNDEHRSILVKDSRAVPVPASATSETVEATALGRQPSGGIEVELPDCFDIIRVSSSHRHVVHAHDRYGPSCRSTVWGPSARQRNDPIDETWPRRSKRPTARDRDTSVESVGGDQREALDSDLARSSRARLGRVRRTASLPRPPEHPDEGRPRPPGPSTWRDATVWYWDYARRKAEASREVVMREWEPIRRGKPEPTTEPDGQRIVLTIPLESVPPPEWQRIFNEPSGITSTACVPKVEGREISATSSLGQLRACVEHVDRLIEHTNERYVSAVLSAQRETQERAERKTAEVDERLRAAREELEGL